MPHSGTVSSRFYPLIVVTLVVVFVEKVISASIPTVSLDEDDSRSSGVKGGSKRPPNIVFVMADDLGFRDIGYQDSDISTPFLDELAESGVKLDNYYVQYQCGPTRSQLLSGKYQIHTGMQSDYTTAVCELGGLPTRFPTIANVLQKAGYSTHLVGKWHLGFSEPALTPLNRGFDTFFGNLPGFADHYNWSSCDPSWSNVVPTQPSTGIGICGFSLVDMTSPVYTAAGTFSTYVYSEKAVEVVRTAATSDKPFFLYLSYQVPHSPVQAPEEFLSNKENIENHLRQVYAGMVTAMEASIMNVTKAIKDEGLWDNTIFIFSSDNGAEVEQGGSNWPLRGKKGSLWEGGIRAVGFVTSPLLKPSQRGTISGELIHVSDWFPTLAEIAGATLEDSLELDGVSQWATIRDGSPSERTEILHNINDKWEWLGDRLYNDTFDTRIQAAIRIGDYKLLTGDPGDGTWYQVQDEDGYQPTPVDYEVNWNGNSTKNLWLFNIAKDPNEITDLSDVMPEKVQAMLNRLAEYNATMVPPRPIIEDWNCDPSDYGGYWQPWVNRE